MHCRLVTSPINFSLRLSSLIRNWRRTTPTMLQRTRRRQRSSNDNIHARGMLYQVGCCTYRTHTSTHFNSPHYPSPVSPSDLNFFFSHTHLSSAFYSQRCRLEKASYFCILTRTRRRSNQRRAQSGRENRVRSDLQDRRETYCNSKRKHRTFTHSSRSLFGFLYSHFYCGCSNHNKRLCVTDCLCTHGVLACARHDQIASPKVRGARSMHIDTYIHKHSLPAANHLLRLTGSTHGHVRLHRNRSRGSG